MWVRAWLPLSASYQRGCREKPGKLAHIKAHTAVVDLLKFQLACLSLYYNTAAKSVIAPLRPFTCGHIMRAVGYSPA